MKKKVVKWFLPAMLACVMGTTVGCSVKDGNEEDLYLDSMAYEKDATSVNSVFEGEWSVNRQVVDTARLVVRAGGVLRVRLPENYLLNLCISKYMTNIGSTAGADETNTLSAVLGNSAATIGVSPQGYSEQAQYMAFNSATLQGNDAKRIFVHSLFSVTFGSETYSISLLSPENATAMMQNITGQWTLGIPVSAFLVTNLSTGQSTESKLSVPVTLYYNTKRRIE